MIKKAFMIATLTLLVGAGCVSGSQVSEKDSESATPPASTSSGGLDSGKLTVPVPAPSKAEPEPEPGSEARTWSFPGTLADEEISGKQVRMQTSKGEIVFELFEGDAPKTVSNFVYLTNGGYYNGLTFHRVEPGFVIQGGDPEGTGLGGPGYKFEDEPVSRAYDEGIVAMANAGPNTNGSQFFIMLANNSLPPQYTIFGKVTKGLDVVHQISVGDVMTKVVVEKK